MRKQTYRYVKRDLGLKDRSRTPEYISVILASSNDPPWRRQNIQDVYMRQKRRAHVSKEAYRCIKRDVYMCQKRRIDVSK